MCPVCSNPSHSSRKVAPFCSTFHRRDYASQRQVQDETARAAACAEIGEHVEHEGLVHKVIAATMEQKGAVYFTVWTAACGAKPEYPEAVQKSLTCFGCITEDK